MYVKHTNGNYSEKVNFIDENDVFVGYDMSTSCCENYGYIFTDTDDFDSADGILYDDDYGSTDVKTNNESDYNLDGYVFDTSWFEERDQIVVFRLTKEDSPDIFLTLYNSHNGYYGHGFKFMNGDNVIADSYI